MTGIETLMQPAPLLLLLHIPPSELIICFRNHVLLYLNTNCCVIDVQLFLVVSDMERGQSEPNTPSQGQEVSSESERSRSRSPMRTKSGTFFWTRPGFLPRIHLGSNVFNTHQSYGGIDVVYKGNL